MKGIKRSNCLPLLTKQFKVHLVCLVGCINLDGLAFFLYIHIVAAISE